MAMKRRPVILGVDTGVDDALAIMLALVVMSGAIRVPGNDGPVAEFNFAADVCVEVEADRFLRLFTERVLR